MHFIPNAAIKQELLKAVGAASVQDLFADIPPAVRIKGLDLPAGLSDQEAEAYLRKLLRKNTPTSRHPCFVGGTLKEHYVPPFVERLVFRQEFYTSYTAYPNFWGVLEPEVRTVADAAHAKGALLIQGFDLSSLGLLTPPGDLGADIAIGDGTTLGFPLGGGGPQLGIFATHERFARRM